MNNNDERDHAEEASNAALMREETGAVRVEPMVRLQIDILVPESERDRLQGVISDTDDIAAGHDDSEYWYEFEDVTKDVATD